MAPEQSSLKELPEWSTLALSAIVDAVVVAGPDGQIAGWNPGAERLFGYSANEIKGENIQRLAGDGRDWEARDIIARVTAGEVYVNPEAVRRSRDGSPREVTITWSPVRSSAGEVIGMVGVFHDTTTARHVDLALKDRRASDLRAGLVASLFGLSLDLEQASSVENMVEARPLIALAQERIGALLAELRSDADQLARLNLDASEGLAQTMTTLVRELVAPTTTARLNLRPVEPPEEVATALLYVATEALINASRHSSATQIAVDLRETNGAYVLIVQDDGGGFDIERAPSGLGLNRMKVRGARVNGELAILSVPGMGTTVRLSVPM